MYRCVQYNLSPPLYSHLERVEAAGRLVGKEHGTGATADELAADRKALAFSTGDATGAAAANDRVANLLQTHALKRRGGARLWEGGGRGRSGLPELRSECVQYTHSFTHILHACATTIQSLDASLGMSGQYPTHMCAHLDRIAVADAQGGSEAERLFHCEAREEGVVLVDEAIRFGIRWRFNRTSEPKRLYALQTARERLQQSRLTGSGGANDGECLRGERQAWQVERQVGRQVERQVERQVARYVVR